MLQKFVQNKWLIEVPCRPRHLGHFRTMRTPPPTARCIQLACVEPFRSLSCFDAHRDPMSGIFSLPVTRVTCAGGPSQWQSRSRAQVCRSQGLNSRPWTAWQCGAVVRSTAIATPRPGSRSGPGDLVFCVCEWEGTVSPQGCAGPGRVGYVRCLGVGPGGSGICAPWQGRGSDVTDMVERLTSQFIG